jgi:hypothetical protein
MTPQFFQTRARFLQSSRERFSEWGEANNHRIVGASMSEFFDLFVGICDYYGRLKWISPKRPIWYRHEQLVNDQCDRFLGRTPYGKMFSKFSKFTEEKF